MTADPFPNYIAGAWAAGSDAALNINPSDLNDAIGYYAQASASQTGEAIECAAAAFPKWRATSPLVRFEALDRIGSEILARVDELGDMLAREEGKTLPESIGEVARAGQIFKFTAMDTHFLRQCHRHPGHSLSMILSFFMAQVHHLHPALYRLVITIHQTLIGTLYVLNIAVNQNKQHPSGNGNK